MDIKKVVQELFIEDKYNDLSEHLNHLHSLIHHNILDISLTTFALIDFVLLDEIRNIVAHGDTPIYFGKTLRDLKCVIRDGQGLRQHEIYLQYKCPKKLKISSVVLPHSPIMDREYTSIEDVTSTFIKYVNDLACYFHELESIDRFCTVMEPVNKTYRDNYRRILLDDRAWLHVEVTSDGLATNIHLVGQSEEWNDKLQAGLSTWDLDKDIVENIMNVFDRMNFPSAAPKSPIPVQIITPTIVEDEPSTIVEDIPSTIVEDIPSTIVEDKPSTNTFICNICLCTELVNNPGVPQLLCQNINCGVYFHRTCIFQWLVACAGNPTPALGIITGVCPTCLEPITCTEQDN